jgi:hypothetical protein
MEEARRADPQRVADMRRTVLISEQKRQCAEILWSEHPAEALRLAVDAFMLLGGTEGADDGLRSELAGRQVPELDDDVGASERKLFSHLLKVQDSRLRIARRAALRPSDVKQLRITRQVMVVVVALVVVAGGLLWLGTGFYGQHVTASAHFSPAYVEENAIDGKLPSEWLLPDGQLGWIEVGVGRSRRVKDVVLQNGQNLPHKDRGIKEFTITAFRGDKVTAKRDGAFSKNGERQSIEINADLDRVRVDVKSFFGAGAALAEIELK